MRQPFPASLEKSYVQIFIHKLSKGQQAIWVASEPLPGAPEKECFQIVANHIEVHGGSAVTGWAIWEVPDVFIEAEFHCVWQAPDGSLLDLTPHAHRYDEILFLPDSTITYSGRQVDNVRHALVDDRDVIRWLYLCRRHFKIINTDELADMHGLIRLPPTLAKEYHKVMDEIDKLQSRLDRRYG